MENKLTNLNSLVERLKSLNQSSNINDSSEPSRPNSPNNQDIPSTSHDSEVSVPTLQLPQPDKKEYNAAIRHQLDVTTSVHAKLVAAYVSSTSPNPNIGEIQKLLKDALSIITDRHCTLVAAADHGWGIVSFLHQESMFDKYPAEFQKMLPGAVKQLNQKKARAKSSDSKPSMTQPFRAAGAPYYPPRPRFPEQRDSGNPVYRQGYYSGAPSRIQCYKCFEFGHSSPNCTRYRRNFSDRQDSRKQRNYGDKANSRQ